MIFLLITYKTKDKAHRYKKSKESHFTALFLITSKILGEEKVIKVKMREKKGFLNGR